MPARKQFRNIPSVDRELEQLIESSKRTLVTEEVLHEQRISFAFGNAINAEKITKDSVRHASQHIQLKQRT